MCGNNFNGRGRNNSVEVKRTPIELTDKNYVDQAKCVIQRLIDKYDKENILTTSKIRKLLSMISDMYTKAKRLKGSELNSDLVSKVQYLKMHTIYEAGREQIKSKAKGEEKKRSVRNFIEEAQIIEQIDNIGSDREKFILFCHYMEALVAYRKYLVEGDE